MNHQREIEVKYVFDASLLGWSLETFGRRIQSLPFLTINRTLFDCYTNDYYFPSSNASVRLRDSWGLGNDGFSRQLKELTIKQKDRGSNFNRLEENIHVDDCATVYRSLCLVLGTPHTTLLKKEEVYWTTNGLVISISAVNENYQKLYLEVEGPNETLVLNTCQLFEENFDLQREPRSLIEMFENVKHVVLK